MLWSTSRGSILPKIMEFEIALKITKTREDVTSTNLHITKDRAGPLFVSRETESMFTLTAHLKGFKRDRIMIEISEDGNRISISGDTPVQEMVMVKWRFFSKQTEIISFKKVFLIPDGIILDKIKAKFNEEDRILTIFMPKSTKGIQGIEIQQVKEEASEGESSQTTTSTSPPAEVSEMQPEPEQPETTEMKESDPIEETSSDTRSKTDLKTEVDQTMEDQPTKTLEEIQPESENPMEMEPAHVLTQPEHLNQQNVDNLEAIEEEDTKEHGLRKPEDAVTEKPMQDEAPEMGKQTELNMNQDVQALDEEIQQDGTMKDEGVQRKETEIVEENEEIDQIEVPKEKEAIEGELSSIDGQEDGDGEVREEETPSRRCHLCGPCIFAGSAFLGFLIVLVFQLLKKQRSSRK